jgi:hypothetical protein
MPFKSKKQRRWMWANEPEMAKKWSDEEKQAKRKEGKTLKITKSKLRQIIQEEIKTLKENDEEELSSPELQALLEEGKAYFDKLISLGKTDRAGDAEEVIEALDEYVGDKSFEHVTIKTTYY